MLHFCFSLKSSNFLQILSLRKGGFYLLPGIAITAGGQWKPEKKMVRTNLIIAKKNGGDEQSGY